MQADFDQQREVVPDGLGGCDSDFDARLSGFGAHNYGVFGGLSFIIAR